jgi:ethanolamine utilization protein EutN
MYLGRVIGCVWATVKNPQLVGQRMLLIQPVTPELQPTGKRLVCLDATGAGAGELIYYVRGKEASFPFLPAEPPTDSTVVGIVDTVHVKRPAKAAIPRNSVNKKARKSC